MDEVAIKREEERFREAAVEARRRSRIPEKALADINNINPSQVSRWFSYTGNQQFPAFRLAFNPPAIVIPILKYLALRHDYVLVKRTEEEKLNGTISDEVFQLAAEVGKLADDAKDGKVDPKQAIELFQEIINTANKGLAEVQAMQVKVHKMQNHGKERAEVSRCDRERLPVPGRRRSAIPGRTSGEPAQGETRTPAGGNMKPFPVELAEQKFLRGLVRLERDYGFYRADRPSVNVRGECDRPLARTTKMLALRWITQSWEEVCN